MLTFLPEDIQGRVLLLILGGLLLLLGGAVVLRTRKRMPMEAWIALLALCVIGALGCLGVVVCTSALFVIAQ